MRPGAKLRATRKSPERSTAPRQRARLERLVRSRSPDFTRLTVRFTPTGALYDS